MDYEFRPDFNTALFERSRFVGVLRIRKAKDEGIGLYGWMVIVTFAIFGRKLEKTDPIFRFMMQIAMLAGFLTRYPVN